MNVTFLGTGAADWSYDLHKNVEGYRRNSSLLIDGCLLIDPGPNVLDALNAFNVDAHSVKHILNTHRHSDHYSSDTVSFLSWASFYPLKRGETISIGKYTVSALGANHSTCTEAVHFIISDGEKKLFYGLDGAWLMYEEVEAIKKGNIDMAILDATVGNAVGDYRIFEHNNLRMVIEMKATLESYVKRWVISHMARTLHTSHAELAAQMKAHGIEVAFDGLQTEI